MFRHIIFSSTLVLASTVAHVAHAQATTNSTSPKLDPVLVAEAKIPLDSARAIALRKVKNGTVASEELEREHGRLIYSFDVKVPGKSGIQEVTVSALTGAVLGVHHESAATEAREAREDSVAAAKKATDSLKPH